jgi:hypothetical protein
MFMAFNMLASCLSKDTKAPSTVLLGVSSLDFQSDLVWESYEGIMVGATACIFNLSKVKFDRLKLVMDMERKFQVVVDPSEAIQIVGSFFAGDSSWQEVNTVKFAHLWKSKTVLTHGSNRWIRNTYCLERETGDSKRIYIIQIDEPTK